MAKFHQGHAQRVPTIEEIRRHFHTTPVLFHSTVQIADGQITVCVIKNFVGRLFHQCRRVRRRHGGDYSISLW
jgi:hypothetical protein